MRSYLPEWSLMLCQLFRLLVQFLARYCLTRLECLNGLKVLQATSVELLVSFEVCHGTKARLGIPFSEVVLALGDKA